MIKVNDLNDSNSTNDLPEKSWLKKIGLLGLAFFLVKGLLWLFMPALLLYFGS